MRVATFNIKHGDDGSGRVDLGRLRAACRALEADVLAVQEVERFGRRTGFRDEMRLIGRATGLRTAFGEAARRKWRSYGNVLAARGPITDVEVVGLPRPPGSEQRVAILARVEVDGIGLSVGATHLSFRPGEGAVQLEVLIEALAARPGPRLLLGDLNIGPDLALPLLGAAGFAVAPTDATFPASAPRRRIDYVAVSGLGILGASTPAVGTSDHLPVVAEVG
ncbi:MAG TPA: endonuclease/exonuclease/phosphatase family protein [Acidimicrobiia bacterium]|nr:endonuclease/exonuclease/phosphatase family protein [Acidimicrobiia bacterium]